MSAGKQCLLYSKVETFSWNTNGYLWPRNRPYNWFFIYFQICRYGIKRSVFHYFVKSFFSVKYNNFVLIDATDRSKINSDQKRLFFAVSLYPFYFSRTLPLIFSKKNNQTKVFRLFLEITSVSNLSKNIFHKCLL